jgi:saccharopine dehydrogenase-like NADP-dependent oxidoreductase
LTFLNEIGLDPGIDHLIAMRMIDQARARGERIRSLISWCGGLPAPEASRNPFGYKFSWNPRGVLTAGKSSAVYRKEKQIIHVSGDELYQSAREVSIYPALHLEGFPNRDSLKYAVCYGIEQEVATIFRGTLRYKGYSELMYGLLKLGLFDEEPMMLSSSWKDIISKKLGITVNHQRTSSDHWMELLKKRLQMSYEQAQHMVNALQWLGMLDEGSRPSMDTTTLLDSMSELLQQKLKFKKDERDMVLLHHQIEMEDIKQQQCLRRSSTMLVYGEQPYGRSSAMAKTVGVPAAIATQLILRGKIDRKGVVVPIYSDIYEPILKELEMQGIRYEEEEDSNTLKS